MQRQAAFTVIEVLITMAILAILVAIALPNYNNYVTRSKIQEATSNLLSMRVKMEQFFQDNRAYPTTCALPPAAPSATQIIIPQLRYFNMSCQGLAANAYILRVDGTDGSVVGLRLEINEANQRWTRSVPAAWGASAAAGIPKQCWVAKTSGDC